MLLLEVYTDRLLINQVQQLSESEKYFIFEHLLYTVSKLSAVPTLLVKIEPCKITIKYGYYYFEIAKILKKEMVKLVVDPSSSESCIQDFIQVSSAKILNWGDEVRDNSFSLIEFSWHVFFFERAINDYEKKIFEETIINFLGTLKLPIWADNSCDRIRSLSYQHLGQSVEFEAYIPIGDESWHQKSRALLIDFHLKYVPIVSYQGRKFIVER
jgi:hypothetical protein